MQQQMVRSLPRWLVAFWWLLLAVPSHGAGSPVEKVVNLLKELKDRIQGDASREQQMYDKYACWCEATTAHKASVIEAAKTELGSLGQSILSLKGKVATLSSEIESTTAEIKANQESQQQATMIRQKENAAYMAETAEMKQALAALEKALFVLGAATGGTSSAYTSFLQRSEEQSATAFQSAIQSLPVMALAKLAPEKLSLVRTYAKEMMHLQGREKTGYAPQSLTIQGILEEMYSTFGSDLESATLTEATENHDYEVLMESLAEALATLEDMLRKHIADKAEAEQMLSEAVQAYDDVEGQLHADVEFFGTTKSGCQAKSQEWTQRKALRDQELEGIDKALAILSTDEARELFGRSIKAGIGTGTVFLQLSGEPKHVPVKAHAGNAKAASVAAFRALKAKATASHSLRLAALAARVSTAEVGHFEDVIKAIDTMIQVLKDEEADDYAKRDQCVEQFHQIDSSVANLSWSIEKNNARISKLKSLIQLRGKELDETIQALEDVKADIKSLNETREDENEAYLAAKKDDQDAILLLEQAKAVFMKYYQEQGIHLGVPSNATLLLQAPANGTTPAYVYEEPHVDFSAPGHRHVESGGIVKLMQVIIEDLQEELSTSEIEEANAQLAYEKSLEAARKLRSELTDSKINLEGAIADRKAEKQDEEGYRKDNKQALTEEKDYQKEIKPDCDWIIGAFDERREKRTTEMNGLTQAKAFLAGYMEKQEDVA